MKNFETIDSNWINLENTIIVITADHGELVPSINLNGEIISYFGKESVHKILWGFERFIPQTLIPLRNKFLQLLPYLRKKYKCHQHPHPGYDLKDAHTDRYLKEMAIAINKARITLTDTGLPRSRYGKYIEIPMCETSAICGDLPDDKADDYSYVIEVTNKMSQQEIYDTISYYLDNEDKMRDIYSGLSRARGHLIIVSNQQSINYLKELYNN